MKYLMVCLCSVVFWAGSFSPVVKAQESASVIATEEIIGKIISVDLEGLSFVLEYASDDSVQPIQSSTFFITDITMIDIANVKSELNDLKPGMSVFAEYARMPDGTKVVESVWVKQN